MESNSLRKRIIIFVLAIMIPLVTSNIASIIISRNISNNYRVMTEKLNSLKEIKAILNQSFESFNKYFQSTDEECKEQYMYFCNLAKEQVMLIEIHNDVESKYIINDLINTINSYKDQGEKTMTLFDNHGAIDAYYSEYLLARENYGYCNTFITKLDESFINYNSEVYTKSQRKEDIIYKVLIAYILVTIIVTLFYTIFFTKNILNKIYELVYASQRVSNGDFSGMDLEKTDIYELDIVFKTFNEMLGYLKGYINSIEEKAKLEKKIRDDEVEILRYENALKVAQLNVLQSQINPHFLFNTLNCINKTARKEKAYLTEDLITSVASLLRYSISRMNRNSSLKEEIEIVKQYIFIQKNRFDERIVFKLDFYESSNMNKVEVPGMTLQPLVENAFIHGIEPKEDGGEIYIKIEEKDRCCLVIIEDNGVGIDEETLRKINSNVSNYEHKGHTTGLGVRCVAERLEILYGSDFNFKIESKLGVGTRIVMEIPNGGVGLSAKDSIS